MKNNSEKKSGHEEANLLRFLSFRPRSVKEIRDYGKKKKIPKSSVENFIKNMKQMEYLDDEKFARLWVRDRKKIMGLGKGRLTRELLQKGLDKKIIIKVLAEEYSPADDQASILEFIRKKKNTAREKIVAGLLRRGFDYQTVKKILFQGQEDSATAVGYEGEDQI